MLQLTGKQKRALRGQGQTLDAAIHIGKSGLGDEVVSNTSELLDQNELIKVRLVGPITALRKDIAQQLANATESICAGIVGHTFLLYRPNDSLPRDQRIVLPK